MKVLMLYRHILKLMFMTFSRTGSTKHSQGLHGPPVTWGGPLVWHKRCNTNVNSIPFHSIQSYLFSARIACWLERQTRDKKIVSSNPGRSCGRIFFSKVNSVCWLLFGVCSTPVLSQWHVKDPGHSAKSADGRLHLNMHTSLTQWSRSGLTMPLFKHSVGIYQDMSSHTTHQGTLGYNRLITLSHRGLIPA